MNILEDVWKEHIMPKLSIYQIRRLAIVNKEINKIVQPFLDEKFDENAIYDIIANCDHFHINRKEMVARVLKFRVGYYWDFGPADIWEDDKQSFYDHWRYWSCDMKKCDKKGYRQCIVCNNDKLIKTSSVKKHRKTKMHQNNFKTFIIKDKEENFINEKHKLQSKNTAYRLKI